MSDTPNLGVTIKGETAQGLTRIKEKTGLSKSMVANLGLSYLIPRIISGELSIVNGKIVPSKELQKAA